MRIAAIALLSALALAPGADAGGGPATFEISVSERLASTTVLVADRPASLVATVYPQDASAGAARGRARGWRRATLLRAPGRPGLRLAG